jgi:hypothetical protein
MHTFVRPADAMAAIVDARYRELAGWRRWYRTTCVEMFGHRWADLEYANRRELRKLVRLRWAARRAARAAR